MTSYGKLGSDIWKSASGSANADRTTIQLDAQVQDWRQRIPAELQFAGLSYDQGTHDEPHRIMQLLRTLLYLRGNHMRVLIYRHNLLSSDRIMSNISGARLATDIAKDTIRVLDQLSKTSTIYRTNQTTFNYFLVSALAAIFCAVCHAPAQFVETCQAEFYMALDLIKGFSARSHASSRLWKTIKRLKQIGPSLGLSSSTGRAPTVMNSDSMHVGPQTTLRGTETNGSNHWQPEPSQYLEKEFDYSENGYQMSLKLMSMFETAGEDFMEPTEEIGPSITGYTDRRYLGEWQGSSAFKDPRFSELMLGLF